MGLIISLGADHGRAVLQNGEEAIAVNRMPLHAIHHQQPTGFTCGHIVAVGVGCNDNVEILVGILIIVQQCLGLILNTLHTPAIAGVVVLVVSHDSHIITGHIHSSNVVNDLLIVSSCRVVDSLNDAGSQHRLGAGEDGVVRCFTGLTALAGIAFQTVTCQFKQVIGESVAGSRSQIGVVRQSPVSLQNLKAGIGRICTQNSGAHILLCLQTTEAVVQEVSRTVRIRQALGKVGFHNRAEAGTSGLQFRDEIESIHITIEVVHAEGIIGVDTKAVDADIVGHLFNSAGRNVAVVLAVQHQVAQVACPAAQISGSHSCHIGDVHSAEHVTKVNLITIGQLKVINDDVSQIHSIGAVGGILLLNISGKAGNLFTRQGNPVTVVVTINTGTDKVDDQFIGILARVTGRICIGIAFQHLQRADECLIVIHAARGEGGHRQHADHHNDRQNDRKPSHWLLCFHDNSSLPHSNVLNTTLQLSKRVFRKMSIMRLPPQITTLFYSSMGFPVLQ